MAGLHVTCIELVPSKSTGEACLHISFQLGVNPDHLVNNVYITNKVASTEQHCLDLFVHQCCVRAKKLCLCKACHHTKRICI